MTLVKMPRRNAAQYPKNIRRRREIWGTIPILTERIFLCYHNKQTSKYTNAWKALCPAKARFQRTGGWCEPARGGRAAGAGAGGPNERSSRASRERRRYQGAGLLEPERVCAAKREAGWYRGKLLFLSSREQNFCSRGVFYLPLRLSGGHMRKRSVSP